MELLSLFVTLMHIGKIPCFGAIAEAELTSQPLPNVHLPSLTIPCGTSKQVACILIAPVALEMQSAQGMKVTLFNTALFLQC